MRSPRTPALAVLVGLLVFWSFVSPALAQGSGLEVSADYELFGLSVLNGGGHVTWTLTGDTARALRADIVHLFDEYPQIPRGFLFHGYATYGNDNGVIEEPEGHAYTDRLENALEGIYPDTQTAGTQVGYFLLDKADLLERDLVGGFNRSTSGITGTDANSTASLQIKFLFNGASNTADVTMPLTTTAYADALFDVFSIEADQSGSWPVVTAPTNMPGWHVKFYDPSLPALWAGNFSSCSFGEDLGCRYDNNANASAATAMDSSPIFGGAAIPLDLRFASTAWVSFNYTGQVADTGDRLQVQVLPQGPGANWTTLPGGTFSQAQNTTKGAWVSEGLNLSAYLGQKVQLRLLFTSNGSGVGPGFFIADFAIHAPAFYTGPILESDAHYLIGTLSFSNFQVPSGNPTLIRTPGGEILFYSGPFDTASPPSDSVRFASFDALENPQVLFVIMIVAAYVISRFQEKAYDDYREVHPSVYRPAVHRVKWLHWLGRIAIGLLILFYFIPTAFFVVGLRVYFNGPAYFFFALTAALGLSLGTRAYYQQMLEAAPPPAGPEAASAGEEEAPEEAIEEAAPEEVLGRCTHCLREIPEGETTYTCSCGALYHLSCAAGLMRCSNCRKPIAGIEKVTDQRSVSMRCESCGEVQTVPEGADPRTLNCTSCGGSLRSLDAGKRYLLVASNPAIAFHWLTDLSKGGRPSLVFSPAAPERLRLEYGLKDTTFVQVASEGAGAIDAKKLDPAGLKSILPLAREGKGGALLYDGLEQMVTASSMGDIVRFLRKANDMAFVHRVTVLARVGPGILAETEIQRLAAEFDEVLDLSARL